MEKSENANNPANVEQESAERFWHLGRGLRVAFLLAFGILVFSFAYTPSEHDIYLDAAHGRLVASDGFGALAGAPRSGWLYGVIAAGVVEAVGADGLAVFAAILVAAAFSVVVMALGRRLNIVVVGLIILPAVYMSRASFAPGSAAVALFVFAAIFALIIDSVKSNSRRFWLVVPLTAFFVNVDFSWTAGAALIAAAIPIVAIAGVPRRWEKCLAFALAVAATLINPDLHHAWSILDAVPVQPASLSAWLSPQLAPLDGGMIPVYVFLVLGALGGSIFVSGEAFLLVVAAVLMIFDGVSAGGFVYPVLAAAASVAAAVAGFGGRRSAREASTGGDEFDRWANIILRPAGAAAETPNDDEWPRLRMEYGISAVFVGVGLVVLLALTGTAAAKRVPVSSEEAAPPAAAMDFAVKAGLGGGVLAPPNWAGYVMWRLGSKADVLATSRPLAADSESAAVAAWAFGGLRWPENAPGTPLAVLRHRDVDWALVPQEWARAPFFYQKWTPVYWDDRSAILVRAGGKYDAVARAHDETLTYPPFSIAVLKPETIDEVAERLGKHIERQGDSVYAHYGLAVCYYLKGELAKAMGEINRACSVMLEFAPAHSLAGDIHRLNGADDLAIVAYTKAVELGGTNPMTYLRLGELRLKQGDLSGGLYAFRTAQKLDDAKPQLDLVQPGLRAKLDEYVTKLESPDALKPASREAESTPGKAPQASGEGEESRSSEGGEYQ